MTAALAIIVSWILLGAMLFGCGRLLSVKLLGNARESPADQRAGIRDVWLGLAALIAYLQVWSLVAPVSGWVVAAPIGASLVGLTYVRWHRPPDGLAYVVALVTTVAFALWFANRGALGPTNYDAGLYHLNAISFSADYGTVPGLGNLHTRLGTSVSHFLLVAFAGLGPWDGAGYHIVNGGLALLLVVELVTRLVGARTGSTTQSQLSRSGSAVLLATFLLLAAGNSSGYISSPNLDFSAYVLVVGASLYLLDAGIASVVNTDAATGLALLATLATSRYQFLPSLCVAAVLVLVWLRPRTGESIPRSVLTLLVLPFVTVAACLTRSVILSGYPLFPSTVGGLPVPWRVRRVDAIETANAVKTWARAPRQDRDEVLASWDWLGPWLERTASHSWVSSVGTALILTSLSVPVFAIFHRLADRRSRCRQARSNRLVHIDRPWVFLFAPNAVMLVVWFFTAPDVRFAFGPLAITSLCCVAAVDQGFFAHRGYCPATLTFGALVGYMFLTGGNLGWQEVRGTGPFGSVSPPTPIVDAITLDSGLTLFMPQSGDQCWEAIPCAPEPPSNLILRGTNLADGFERSTDHPSVPQNNRATRPR